MKFEWLINEDAIGHVYRRRVILGQMNSTTWDVVIYEPGLTFLFPTKPINYRRSIKLKYKYCISIVIL